MNSVFRIFAPLCVCAALFPVRASAQELAELYSAEGKVEGRVAPKTEWAAIERGQKFAERDGVRTLEQSRAGVRFSTGYLVRMNEKTTINFSRTAQTAGKGRMSVLQGIGHFFSKEAKEFPSVNTPHVSASVRGTEFVVAVQGDETLISVLDGAVTAENQFGSVDLGKGEQALTRAGSAPVKQLIVRQADAVQWALYYPAVFHASDFADFVSTASPQEVAAIESLENGDLAAARAGFSAPTWQSAVGRSLAAYREGNSADAIAELRKFGGDQPAGMKLLEASLLLSSGQAEQAERALSAAEQRIVAAPESARSRLRSLILAERSVIQVVRGDRRRGEALANEARALSPHSAAASLALSFVRQSQFRLDEARALLEETVRLEPSSSVAKARLAELLLGFGEREEAVRTAEEALRADPDNAYVLAVLGFAELTRYNTERASEMFTRSLKSDSGFALPMLGLGLATIRSGDLEGGRVRLEEAVQLDPMMSLYRSYLGKSYYEEDREHLALQEYERAIELDPLDPTPYLYRSYAKLATHRPVEALGDLQESIRRNDNRAVFRSRLLLDQDQGTRSTGLGEIYSRLGFSELARVEATRALYKDYANYSAHFLLADLYRDTHLNSRAQVTENLLGRLLSPVSFNANDLNIGGEASLNEYNTLFDRPTERGTVSGYARSRTDAFGGQADYTMSTERLGFNIGYAGSYRDGFRENDWLRTHQLFNLGQLALSPDDTLVWDAALTASDQGDIIVNYDPLLEDPDFESKFDGALFRGGYHRRIGPGAHVVAQAFYNYGDFDGSNDLNANRLSFVNVTEGGVPSTAEPFFYDGRTNEETSIKQHLGRGDIQLIWETEPVSIVAGTSASAERLESDEEAFISDPGSEEVLSFLNGFPITSESDVDEYTTQTFAYGTWHLMPWLDVQTGLVYSRLDYSDNAFTTPFAENTFDEDQWGPKVGVLADLGENASLRMAYSRSLDRTGRGGLGPLEPTFVGGFNQVFDAVRGSEQDLYGAGLDFKFGDRTFTGVSYQRRNIDLNVPIVIGGLNVTREGLEVEETTLLDALRGGADVDRVGTYLYQVIGTTLAGVLDYSFERFNEEDPFPETQTNRVVSQLRYFHPSGVFAFGGATFRYQERAGVADPKEISDFWVLDAGVGLELDHRRGAVSLRFNNILDESFRYSAIADEDPVLPDFGAELDLTLNF